MTVVWHLPMDRQTSPLRAAREAAGMSPEELAFRAGVSLRTIERIEREGVSPRRATVTVLAMALGIDPHEIQAQEAA